MPVFSVGQQVIISIMKYFFAHLSSRFTSLILPSDFQFNNRTSFLYKLSIVPNSYSQIFADCPVIHPHQWTSLLCKSIISNTFCLTFSPFTTKPQINNWLSFNSVMFCSVLIYLVLFCAETILFCSIKFRSVLVTHSYF